MATKLRCRCGQELELPVGQSHIVCPACQRRLKIPTRQPEWDVFISHSAKDKAAADATCAILERHGLRCWIAPRDIVPGSEWSAAIIDGIEHSRLLVLLFSRHSNTSPQVLREVERAVSKGMIIIPLRLDDLAPSKSLEFFISSQHWLDALTPPLEQHLETLATTVRRLLDRPDSVTRPARGSAVPGTSAGEPAEPLVRQPSLRSRWGVMVVVSSVALLAGAGLMSQSWTSPPPEPVDPPIDADEERDDAYAATMRQRFGLMDANGDASTSLAEYAQAMRQHKIPLSIAANLFELVDADEDQQVTAEEFLALSDRWVDYLDQDDSGKLSIGEILQLGQYRGKDGPRQARETLRRFDVNQDGQLDVRETERLLHQRLSN